MTTLIELVDKEKDLKHIAAIKDKISDIKAQNKQQKKLKRVSA